MAPHSKKSSRSRAAVDAQLRRDNEAEAREVLDNRLPAEAFRPDFSTCGEFNLPTKTLLAALFFLSPHANIEQAPKLVTSSVEYKQRRRDNETSIRDQLESIIPARLFTSEIVDRSDFNKTTKVMIAADHRVKEVLAHREDAESSSSASAVMEDIESLADSPTINPYEQPTRETRRSLRVKQSLLVSQQQAVPSHEHVGSPKQNQHASLLVKDTSNSILLRSGGLHSVMSPSTHSSVDAKGRALCSTFNASPSENSSLDDTVCATGPSSKSNDLLVNLRADELDQEMNLNLKPPPLPEKAFENQGHWQIKPRETTQHKNIYVHALEQAANRLVAKAKELVIVCDGDEAACQEPLIEAQEWCVDTISMLAGEINNKDYKAKWNARKKVWEKRADYGVSFDD